MTYTAKVTLKYDSTWEQTRGIYDEEMIPEEHITFEAPVEDINSIQLFQLFAKFALSMGHNETGIAKGACYVAFNDMRSIEDMRKTAHEYDLMLDEDYHKKLEEYDADQDKEIKKLEAEIRQLKEKLARVLPQEYEQPDNDTDIYDEDILRDDGSSWNEPYKTWGELIPGSPEAYDKGCKCPILDNQEMPKYKKWVSADCPLHGKSK
jgi:hypothetical protein